MKQTRRTFLRQATLAAGSIMIVPRHVLGRGFIAPSDKIVLGFIGLGKQSGGLANQFGKIDLVEIAGGSDVWTTKMDWFKAHVGKIYAEQKGNSSYQGLKLYPDYQQLIANPDIDAVVIASPDHWHAVMAIHAMQAGKDVYCEKPMTHTVQEGIDMVEATRKNGRIVQVGSMQRSWDNFYKACSLVRNGYVGDISKVLVNVGDPAIPYNLAAEPVPEAVDWDRWCGPTKKLAYNNRLAPARNDVDFWPDWRLYKETGGGILADWGAHMFDIAQWGLGMDRSGPVSFTPPADPTAVRGMRMVYDNGVEMVHEDFGRGWAVRFIGSEGSLDISRQFFDSKPEKLIQAEIKPGDVKLYQSTNHYEDFIAAIKNRTAPICDVETGHRSASVCNLANIAYWLNRPLKWDPVVQQFPGDKEANNLLDYKHRSKYKI
ncbi:MAG: Gfo/Idh/MocA family oxidoreductase [Saprospiraceae bacterium]